MTRLFFGHNRQIDFIINAIKRKSIPNAWLFYGPKGIGKAALALKVGKLLTSLNYDDQDSLNNTSSEHLRTINMELDIQNIYYCQRQKEEKKERKNKFININDIRKMQKFFSLASTEKTYRTCVIDSTEDLNLQSSNALLKILEEPPEKTLFILISNNIHSVIPTIASRCQRLQFHGLDKSEIHEFAKTVFKDIVVENHRKEQIIKMSSGSPGQLLLSIEEEFISVLEKIEGIISDFPKLNPYKIHSLLVDHPTFASWDDSHRSIMGIYINLISNIVYSLIKADNYDSKTLNKSFWKNLSTIPNIDLLIAHLYSQLDHLRSESHKFNLDPKKIIFLSFHLFEKLSR